MDSVEQFSGAFDLQFIPYGLDLLRSKAIDAQHFLNAFGRFVPVLFEG